MAKKKLTTIESAKKVGKLYILIPYCCQHIDQYTYLTNKTDFSPNEFGDLEGKFLNECYALTDFKEEHPDLTHLMVEETNLNVDFDNFINWLVNKQKFEIIDTKTMANYVFTGIVEYVSECLY